MRRAALAATAALLAGAGAVGVPAAQARDASPPGRAHAGAESGPASFIGRPMKLTPAGRQSFIVQAGVLSAGRQNFRTDGERPVPMLHVRPHGHPVPMPHVRPHGRPVPMPEVGPGPDLLTLRR